jgi:transcriptional accessory protein Tex/SPT6
MDLTMVKQEQGETLQQYMHCFFDKRATIVDITDKQVNECFQDGLYHHRTFEDFGRHHPSSITKLKDMITSWVDEEDKANAKYDFVPSKSKNNTGGNNNNKDQGGGNNNNNNNYSGPNHKRKPDNTVAPVQPCEGQLQKDLRRLQRLAQREVPLASRRQPHNRSVLSAPASTQGYS